MRIKQAFYSYSWYVVGCTLTASGATDGDKPNMKRAVRGVSEDISDWALKPVSQG